MAKLKGSVLSLSAKGSLGSALTFQKNVAGQIVRTKPIPTYRRTLLQQYRRWLYQDAIDYWSTLSLAQKATYRPAASREHITPFSAFIRYYLTDLPDLLGYWHLDNAIAGYVPDFSRQDNPGEIHGPTPTNALIDKGFLFDGVDDYITMGVQSELTSQAFTVQIFFKPHTLSTNCSLCNYYGWAVGQGGFHIRQNYDDIAFHTFIDASEATQWIFNCLTLDQWHCIEATWDGTTKNLYSNDDVATPQAWVNTMKPSSNPFVLGIRCDNLTSYPLDGIIDHIVYRNRVISSEQRLRDRLRRYP